MEKGLQLGVIHIVSYLHITILNLQLRPSLPIFLTTVRQHGHQVTLTPRNASYYNSNCMYHPTSKDYYATISSVPPKELRYDHSGIWRT